MSTSVLWLIPATLLLTCCRAENAPSPQVAAPASAGPSVERVLQAAHSHSFPFTVAIGDFAGDLDDAHTKGTAWIYRGTGNRDYERDQVIRQVHGRGNQLIEVVLFKPSPTRTLHDDLRALANDRVIRGVAVRYADSSVGVVLDEETNATLNRLKNLLTARPGAVEVVWAYFEQ